MNAIHRNDNSIAVLWSSACDMLTGLQHVH